MTAAKAPACGFELALLVSNLLASLSVLLASGGSQLIGIAVGQESCESDEGGNADLQSRYQCWCYTWETIYGK